MSKTVAPKDKDKKKVKGGKDDKPVDDTVGSPFSGFNINL